MRRLSAALAIAVLAALLLPLCVSADTGRIPHEDPNAVSNEVNQNAVLLYYTQMFMQVDQGDYASAIKMLGKLDFAHMTDSQRQLLAKYSGLLQRLPDTISSYRNMSDTIMSLIAQYRLTEAQEKLDNAKLLVEQLNQIPVDIAKDTENIGNAFGISSSQLNSLLNTSYGALQNSIGQINEIANNASYLQNLINETLATTTRQGTNLTLEISSASAYVGDTITVSGSLSTKISKLTGKNISITLDERAVTTAITDSGGGYTASIQLHYENVSNMSVRALYMPIGSDLNKYLPAVSPIQNISVKFYQSAIEINPPKEIYPGLPAVFNGSVNWEQPNDFATRNISIYLDNDLLGTTSTGVGAFEIKTTIGLNESLGTHKISAVLAPSGRYANASAEKALDVAPAPLRVEVDAPSFIITPGKISITGKVTSELPMQGGNASINCGGQSTTVEIRDNGDFSANLSFGIEGRLLGPSDLTVKVNPVEPWNAASTIKTNIFIFNTVNIATISLCLVAGVTVGTMTYARRKRRRPLKGPTRRPIATTTEKVLATTPAVTLQPGSGEPRERLLNAYTRARSVIEKASATKMEPHVTMREFAAATQKKGIVSAGNFTKLTSMAEKGQYSSHEIEGAEATAAEELLSAIVEGIQRGAA